MVRDSGSSSHRAMLIGMVGLLFFRYGRYYIIKGKGIKIEQRKLNRKNTPIQYNKKVRTLS